MLYFLTKKIKERYTSEGGYGEFLYLAIPLILTTSSWSIQHFVDRMFLSWYSPSAVASAMSAGSLNFTFLSFFIGIVTYTSTFVAQYYGASLYKRIGEIVWQGIYLSIIGSLIIMSLIFFSDNVFNAIGHVDEIKKNEMIYFNILCSGALPMLLSSCLSSFYSGIGKTWTIMWVNLVVTCVNIIFDYLLIFGKLFFPEFGIAGAAIATVFASIVNLVIYICMIFRRKNEQYNIRSVRFNKILFFRLINYGFPAGLQFFLDMAGFSLFLLFIGKIGVIELAATSIAFNVSTLVFMPMIGSGIAVSIMVGQYLGSNRSLYAERSVYSGFTIALIYMSTVSFCYFFFPEIFINPFIKSELIGDYKTIKGLAMILLKFVAVYSIFDTFNIMFSAALKGAGDTKFIMLIIAILSIVILILPSYVVVYYLHGNIFVLWLIFSIYIALLGLSFFIRFFVGKWKSMRVIEAQEIMGI
jgi:MATE family multidrug resistance protein